MIERDRTEPLRFRAYCKKYGYREDKRKPPRCVCSWTNGRCGKKYDCPFLLGAYESSGSKQTLWDHVRFLRDSKNRWIVTSQPYCPPKNYDVLSQRAKEFAEFHGLGFRVSNADSWWNPGFTVLVEFFLLDEETPNVSR